MNDLILNKIQDKIDNHELYVKLVNSYDEIIKFEEIDCNTLKFYTNLINFERNILDLSELVIIKQNQFNLPDLIEDDLKDSLDNQQIVENATTSINDYLKDKSDDYKILFFRKLSFEGIEFVIDVDDNKQHCMITDIEGTDVTFAYSYDDEDCINILNESLPNLYIDEKNLNIINEGVLEELTVYSKFKNLLETYLKINETCKIDYNYKSSRNILIEYLDLSDDCDYTTIGNNVCETSLNDNSYVSIITEYSLEGVNNAIDTFFDCIKIYKETDIKDLI